MKFNLDGITLEFEVREYERSIREKRNFQWCRTSISVSSSHINYFEDSRAILSYELEIFCRHLGMLLDGTLPKSEHLFLTEPVLEFSLRPATADGEADIDMYWIINMRDDEGTVTANNLHLLFDRQSIKKLYRYLKEVTGIV